MPLDGHFFVEIPRVPRVRLRGFTRGTDVGGRVFELPAHEAVPGHELARLLYRRPLQSPPRRAVGTRPLAWRSLETAADLAGCAHGA